MWTRPPLLSWYVTAMAVWGLSIPSGFAKTVALFQVKGYEQKTSGRSLLSCIKHKRRYVASNRSCVESRHDLYHVRNQRQLVYCSLETTFYLEKSAWRESECKGSLNCGRSVKWFPVKTFLTTAHQETKEKHCSKPNGRCLVLTSWEKYKPLHPPVSGSIDLSPLFTNHGSLCWWLPRVTPRFCFDMSGWLRSDDDKQHRESQVSGGSGRCSHTELKTRFSCTSLSAFKFSKVYGAIQRCCVTHRRDNNKRGLVAGALCAGLLLANQWPRGAANPPVDPLTHLQQPLLQPVTYAFDRFERYYVSENDTTNIIKEACVWNKMHMKYI